MKKITELLGPEWIKLQKYKTFWMVSGLYAATFLLVLLSLQSMVNNIQVNVNSNAPVPFPSFSVYSFPLVWQNLTYVAGYLKMFPAFLIILLITNEFTFKTLKQQVITGTSRFEFLAAKIALILLLSLAVAGLTGISGLLAGIFQSDADYASILSSKIWFLAAHMLELVTYLMFAAFLAVLLKRAGITVIVFLIYSFILEKILVFRLPGNLGRFLPVEAAGNLIPLPNSSLIRLFGLSFREYTSLGDAAICIAWIAIFGSGMYWLLKNRDL